MSPRELTGRRIGHNKGGFKAILRILYSLMSKKTPKFVINMIDLTDLTTTFRCKRTYDILPKGVYSKDGTVRMNYL